MNLRQLIFFFSVGELQIRRY